MNTSNFPTYTFNQNTDIFDIYKDIVIKELSANNEEIPIYSLIFQTENELNELITQQYYNISNLSNCMQKTFGISKSKDFKHWINNSKAHRQFVKDTNKIYKLKDSIYYIIHNDNQIRGTYVHKDIYYKVAQWMYEPYFRGLVSGVNKAQIELIESLKNELND